MRNLENLAREVQEITDCDYLGALEVFQTLIKSKIHEEKFMAVLFLNRFKRYFDERMINLFRETFKKHCDTWALCDSSMIKVLGPFLAKKWNEQQVKGIIESWSSSEDLWVRRASLVIYLKTVMIKKDFDKDDSEPYIQKAIAWLLRTCSRYRANIVFEYLIVNRKKPLKVNFKRRFEKTFKGTEKQTVRVKVKTFIVKNIDLFITYD